MAHSPGRALVHGDVVAHFEYNGTVDTARSQLFKTADERDEAWRQDQPPPCRCAGEEVTLFSEGLTWDAHVCFVHMCITAGRQPEFENTHGLGIKKEGR